MTLKAWKLLSVAAALMAASPALAQSADRVATHGNWSVFVAANPKECYIVSAPTASSARRDGKPAEVTRGDIRLFVSFRPGDKVSNEVSFTGGYPFSSSGSVKLAVGSDAFQMAPGKGDGGEWAWTDPSDDSKAVAAMKRGSEAKLSGTSSRGTSTEDRFSLTGFTAAVEDAATRCR
jgi:hypothetical protein